MNHIGLFEGIGGFSLAARWMGWKTVAWCEINPFCRTVLKYHYPDAEGHSDIKSTDFSIYRGQCDILTGGFPCQPYSTAGKRLGKEDDRHLWPEMLRAIREIAPRWIVGENVRGLISWNGGMVFDEVQTDMEAAFRDSETHRSLRREGYESFPILLPACGVNAPHRRERIWFVAYADGGGSERYRDESGKLSKGGQWGANYEDVRYSAFGESGKPNTADSEGQGLEGGAGLQEQGAGRPAIYGENLTKWPTADAERQRQPGQGRTEQSGDSSPHSPWKASWSDDVGRWPVESPLCGRNDGIPGGLSGITLSKFRKESIKALGNAIVPQVALQIFKAIEQYEASL